MQDNLRPAAAYSEVCLHEACGQRRYSLYLLSEKPAKTAGAFKKGRDLSISVQFIIWLRNYYYVEHIDKYIENFSSGTNKFLFIFLHGLEIISNVFWQFLSWLRAKR